MAFSLYDRVKETATTTGTGDFTLAGAATGYRKFSDVFSTNDLTYYCIQHQTTGEWEVGLGTYSASNTLTRTTVIASSNSNLAVSFSAGTKDVFVTLAAETFYQGTQVCQGRLTADSSNAVTTNDATSTTIYFKAYLGDKVSLYTGSRWKIYSLTSTIQLSLGAVTSGLPYDIFIYDSSGSLTLEKVAWTNASTRATALTTKDQVYVKNGDNTRRYLGTICADSTTTTCDKIGTRYVWNYYNRVQYSDWQADSTDTWTNAGNGTWSAMNSGNAAWIHYHVIGVAENTIEAEAEVSTAGGTSFIMVGYDGSTTLDRSVTSIGMVNTAGTAGQMMCIYSKPPAVGQHSVNAMQTTYTASTVTFYGDNGGSVGGGALGSNSGMRVRGWR